MAIKIFYLKIPLAKILYFDIALVEILLIKISWIDKFSPFLIFLVY